jgi:hypothetical protein
MSTQTYISERTQKKLDRLFKTFLELYDQLSQGLLSEQASWVATDVSRLFFFYYRESWEFHFVT